MQIANLHQRSEDENWENENWEDENWENENWDIEKMRRLVNVS